MEITEAGQLSLEEGRKARPAVSCQVVFASATRFCKSSDLRYFFSEPPLGTCFLTKSKTGPSGRYLESHLIVASAFLLGRTATSSPDEPKFRQKIWLPWGLAARPLALPFSGRCFFFHPFPLPPRSWNEQYSAKPEILNQSSCVPLLAAKGPIPVVLSPCGKTKGSIQIQMHRTPVFSSKNSSHTRCLLVK